MKLGVAAMVGLAIGIYVLAALIPGAITSLFGADTSSWDASTVALWAVVPIIVIAGILLVVLPRGGGKGAG